MTVGLIDVYIVLDIVAIHTVVFFVICLVAAAVASVTNHHYGLLERIFTGFILLRMLMVSLYLLRSATRLRAASDRTEVVRA